MKHLFLWCCNNVVKGSHWVYWQDMKERKNNMHTVRIYPANTQSYIHNIQASRTFTTSALPMTSYPHSCYTHNHLVIDRHTYTKGMKKVATLPMILKQFYCQSVIRFHKLIFLWLSLFCRYLVLSTLHQVCRAVGCVRLIVCLVLLRTT